MTATTAPILAISPTAEPTSLGPIQMAWLAGAIFVVSAGYGALLPLLPDWLTSVLPGASVPDVSRHVGFISGVYAVGVLAGAPLWGLLSDRVGRRRVLIVGLTGYITSQILLLVPGLPRLWEIYMLRAAAGFFVAAIVPVVAALIAEYSSEDQRARRFAWLGAMSLLGFLIGPGLTAVADWMGSWVGDGASSPILSVQIVLALSASLGGVTMLGLVLVLPPARVPYFVVQAGLDTEMRNRPYVLWGLSGVLMFVLAGFELGIVLQGQQSPNETSRQAAIMLAQCSLVMLGVNAMLFATSMLDKISARILIGTGLILAISGLLVLAVHPADAWMYVGVSLTAAGTGLVLPVIAYLAAGASPQKLGAIMGGLAAASGFGQSVGSAAGGWLFSIFAQRTFGWLALPLLLMLGLVLARPGRWWERAWFQR